MSKYNKQVTKTTFDTSTSNKSRVHKLVGKIIGLYKEFKNNVQTTPGKRNDDWKQRMSKYNKQVTKTTFDISTSNK